MKKDRLPLLDYFDYAFREIYSLEEMLANHNQPHLSDVLRSVVEMAYGKLSTLEMLLDREVGQLQVQLNEHGEPERVVITAKPKNESIH